MLNIYYARENIDKTKFIYDELLEPAQVIVPEQFSLQAVREAYKYTGKEALLDTNITTLSKLGADIIAKTSGNPKIISSEGRLMLLTKVLKGLEGELQIFARSIYKIEFVKMLDELIADIKQHEVTPSVLFELAENTDNNHILREKIREVAVIYESYEKALADVYMDSVDYITYYTERIPQAKFLENNEIWIYGFDVFTKKNINIIKTLLQVARNVNLIITYDPSEEDITNSIFAISHNLIATLKSEIDDISICEIPINYVKNQSKEIAYIEANFTKFIADKIEKQGNIKLVKAANAYSEIKTAARYVLELVEKEGYRYKDIAVIANDIIERQNLYKRVFAEYGIKLFVDDKRNLTHHPVANYLFNLLDILCYGFEREKVIELIKTGLTCVDDEDIEDLEIYARKYNITRVKWTIPFTKALTEKEKTSLEKFEELRKALIVPLIRLREEFKFFKKANEKTAIIRKYFDEVDLEKQICEMLEIQENFEEFEIAEETSQVWNVLVEILEQMNIILGDAKVSIREFVDILKSGLESVKLGVLPPTVDGLVIGNMQRTRRSMAKVTIILGASDGLLPMTLDKADVFSDNEKDIINAGDMNICKSSTLREIEERLAIYRNIANTTDKLYLSYASSNDEGKQVEPSEVYIKIKELVDGIDETKDIFNDDMHESFIGGLVSTQNILFSKLAEIESDMEQMDQWIDVYNWFVNEKKVDDIVENLFKNTEQEGISSSQVQEMYFSNQKDYLSLSPSRLEKYGKCPFSHFVNYALYPEELREYKLGAPETGDIYHECIMKISQKLSNSGNDKNWYNANEADIENMVEKTLADIVKIYKDGLLCNEKQEEYRAERLKFVCIENIKMIMQQIRQGRITNMYFEKRFGSNSNMDAIRCDNKNDWDVRIEGKIDRVDLLEGGYSRVIDYKSGNDKYSEKEAKAGIKLQLFIYLMATKSLNVDLGGAFYFKIKDAYFDATGKTSEEMADKKANEYKLDGFALESDVVRKGFDKENLSKNSKVYKQTKSCMLPKEDFEKLILDIRNKVNEMVEGIVAGNIEIQPKKYDNGKKNSCTYCLYKGICKFDENIDNMKFDVI